MKFLLPLTLLLASLGNSQVANWFEEMKIGSAWSNTFEVPAQEAVLKGLLVDLGERNVHALYDTETMRWVCGYQGFVKWGGTPWTGQHGALVTVDPQETIFRATSSIGWAGEDGTFTDTRPIQGHGNLKPSHARFLGYYKHGKSVCVASQIHGARVLEMLQRSDTGILRHVSVTSPTKELKMLVADDTGSWQITNALKAKGASGRCVTVGSTNLPLELKADGSRLYLVIPASTETIQIQISYSKDSESKLGDSIDFQSLTKGGPASYPETIESKGTLGKKSADSPWIVDQIDIPTKNPWDSNMRTCAFDLIDQDSLAITTWNGDVWKVSGIAKDMSKLVWQRIASGMFEPLGLKVVNGIIHVLGRDGITQLIDLNGDGETDFYQTFNHDVLITKNFHEFAFDLHTDQQGNFYFCKGSPVRGGGRGFDSILPNHGIVAKVSKDGQTFEVVATGLRAPGGMSVGPQGQITTGENEGSWQPCCKINYATTAQFPAFFGTEPSRHAVGKGRDFNEPLCYLPMNVDNSGGSQVWVPDGIDFGLKAGELIHLSYGQSALYRVLPEKKGDVLQGGVVKIPARLSSSAMRARFHTDGSLFVSGFRGWQTNAAKEMGLQRVRFTPGATPTIPSSLQTTPTGVIIGFDIELDKELAEDITSYNAERWNYVRGPQYGSSHFSVDAPDAAAEKKALEREVRDHRKQDPVAITSAQLSQDKKSVTLELRGMKPSMTLKVGYELETTDGDILENTIYSTVKKVR